MGSSARECFVTGPGGGAAAAAPQPFIQSSCGFSAPPAQLTTQQTTTMYLVPRRAILATRLPVYSYPGIV